jgi:iron(III) transport system ATP-binding protein
MTASLEMRDVARSLGGRAVLRDISLSVPAHSCLVLAGESGSGKSTILRIVGGLEQIDRGEVQIGGQCVAHGKHFTPAEKRRLGMVFQDFALWPHLSALDNVLMAVPKSEANRQTRALDLLDRMGVAACAPRRPAMLSGGQQQRVGIARALAARPVLLLLDEPLSSLDLDTRENLRAELRALTIQDGLTSLLVSHDPADCWQLADHAAILEAGRISQCGTPADLFARPASAYVARFGGACGGVEVGVTPLPSGSVLNFGAQSITLPPLATSCPTKRGKLFWREDAIRISTTGLQAELASLCFEAGRYRTYWKLTGWSGLLSAFLPRPPDQNHALLSINTDKIYLYPIEETI